MYEIARRYYEGEDVVDELAAELLSLVPIAMARYKDLKRHELELESAANYGIVKSLQQRRPPEHIVAYTLRCMYNEMNSYLRGVKDSVSLEAVGELRWEPGKLSEFAEALAQLPPDTIKIIELRIQGLTKTDIAKQLPIDRREVGRILKAVEPILREAVYE